MSARCIVLWLVLCGVGCSCYSIQQTSLVPPAIPSPVPASAPGPDIALLGSYVTRARDRAGLDDASLWVTRGIATGTFEYAWRPASVRVTGFSAPSRGAWRGQPSGFDRPSAPVWGGGPGAVIRLLRDNLRTNLTLTFDSWLVIAPSRIDARCTERCDFASGSGRRLDRSAAFLLNTGLQFRQHALSFLAITASLGFQTLVRNDALREDSRLGGRSKVRMGPPHPLLDLGLEFVPSPWFTFGPSLGWIAPPGTLSYGPSLSFVLRLHVPREPRE